MKTVEEYDKHLQDVYTQSFRDYALKNGVSVENFGKETNPEKYANTMLETYSNAINRTMAQELLNRINLQSPTEQDKLNNYPTMFWKSYDGKILLQNISADFVRKEITSLDNKEELTKEDIKNSFEKVIDFAHKISLKKENLGYKLIENFESSLDNLFYHYIKTDKMTQVTAQDLHDSAVKETIKPENLESMVKVFPEMATSMYKMLDQVKTREEKALRNEGRKTLKVN